MRVWPMCLILILSAVANAQWVEFVEETSTRLDVAASLGQNDQQEKDYAYADLDQDGDIDLVVVRKQPFTSAGKFPNVLLMNENGVLTDRTAEFASAASPANFNIPGLGNFTDQGFLTPTNDRDVIIADFDGDGWLDLVTVPTLSDGDPKHISHPRIYMNLGNDLNGDWLGLRFEDDRIPQLEGFAPGGAPHAPRFCSVDAGDIDGDGDEDLYFGDYDSGGSQTLDFNDRLLINDGNGFFTDETSTRFVGQIFVGGGGFPFQQSAFGTSVALEDFNGDDKIDIAKDTALNAPQYVGISYNDDVNHGSFTEHRVVNDFSPYFLEAGDLNNDGMMDLLVMDDGIDRYHLNLGNASDGTAQFSTEQFSFDSAGPGDQGFPGNSRIVDLNLDGFADVVHGDVDVDISGCGSRMVIYRNLGDVPDVTLQSQGGNQPWTPTGVHDIATFDLNGDTWPDMVIGRCAGTQVWINQPPAGLIFNYPTGLPTLQACNTPLEFEVEVSSFGGINIVPGSFEIEISYNDGPFENLPVTDLGNDLYRATLPAGNLLEERAFRVRAQRSDTGSFETDPPSGTYQVFVGDGGSMISNDMEGDVSGWTVDAPAGLVGRWELAEPNGTTLSGVQVAPNSDATQAADATLAWVTDNGAPGEAAFVSDVDGGQNYLLSEPFDAAGTDVEVSFRAWYMSVTTGGSPVTSNQLLVQVSNDTGGWTTVMAIATTNSSWQNFSFRAGDFVTTTDGMRLRFIANDQPNNAVVEAGIDNFSVLTFACSGTNFVRGEVNQDNAVNLADIQYVLNFLFVEGPDPDCMKSADLNDDGSVNIADAISGLDYLFNGGTEPPAPGVSACGLDATEDSLSCESFDACN